MRIGALVLAVAVFGCVGDAHGGNEFLGSWPTSHKSGGYEFGIKGLYQYDTNQFYGEDALFDDASTWRRKEFNVYLKTPFGLEATAGYDWQNSWVDNYLKYTSDELGDFRLGQFKTQVGWNETESASAQTFLERSLPDSAIYEGRRLGVDWTYGRIEHWTLAAAYYAGGDLDGEHDGRGYSARVVFAPVQKVGDVVHLGVAASRELPDPEVAKISSKPETALTATRLVSTGSLTNTNAIDRIGVEGGWQHGPFLAQAEYLRLTAQRNAGLPDFSGDGYYLTSVWMLTGESRDYKETYFKGVTPAHNYGAIELAARYSELDLRDGIVQGGRQHDWTLGLNWYLGQHLKLQANYVWAQADASPVNAYAVPLDPRVFELRAQLYF